MAKLIALLSSGKGTWGPVNSLMKVEKWDHIYLICNEFAYNNFDVKPEQVTKLKFDEKKLDNSMEKISDFLKKSVKDIDVAVNLNSGTGMEHMALVSTILKSGLGIRFVYADYDELKEFEILGKYEVEEDEF